MKILGAEQGSVDWHQERRGKITGTRVKGLAGRGDQTFWQLLAENLTSPSSDIDGMERGSTLEPEAIAAFEKETGKIVERVGLCVSDQDERIANSPDGLIKEDGVYEEAVEVKCLSSARHLEAYFTHEIPSEYMPQICQYFIVNPSLSRLYFVFYDPRVTLKPIHWIVVYRSLIEEEITRYHAIQQAALVRLDSLINQLTF